MDTNTITAAIKEGIIVSVQKHVATLPDIVRIKESMDIQYMRFLFESNDSVRLVMKKFIRFIDPNDEYKPSKTFLTFVNIKFMNFCRELTTIYANSRITYAYHHASHGAEAIMDAVIQCIVTNDTQGNVVQSKIDEIVKAQLNTNTFNKFNIAPMSLSKDTNLVVNEDVRNSIVKVIPSYLDKILQQLTTFNINNQKNDELADKYKGIFEQSNGSMNSDRIDLPISEPKMSVTTTPMRLSFDNIVAKLKNDLFKHMHDPLKQNVSIDGILNEYNSSIDTWLNHHRSCDIMNYQHTHCLSSTRFLITIDKNIASSLLNTAYSYLCDTVRVIPSVLNQFGHFQIDMDINPIIKMFWHKSMEMDRSEISPTEILVFALNCISLNNRMLQRAYATIHGRTFTEGIQVRIKLYSIDNNNCLVDNVPYSLRSYIYDVLAQSWKSINAAISKLINDKNVKHTNDMREAEGYDSNNFATICNEINGKEPTKINVIDYPNLLIRKYPINGDISKLFTEFAKYNNERSSEIIDKFNTVINDLNQQLMCTKNALPHELCTFDVFAFVPDILNLFKLPDNNRCLIDLKLTEYKNNNKITMCAAMNILTNLISVVTLLRDLTTSPCLTHDKFITVCENKSLADFIDYWYVYVYNNAIPMPAKITLDRLFNDSNLPSKHWYFQNIIMSIRDNIERFITSVFIAPGKPNMICKHYSNDVDQPRSALTNTGIDKLLNKSFEELFNEHAQPVLTHCENMSTQDMVDQINAYAKAIDRCAYLQRKWSKLPTIKTVADVYHYHVCAFLDTSLFSNKTNAVGHVMYLKQLNYSSSKSTTDVDIDLKCIHTLLLLINTCLTIKIDNSHQFKEIFKRIFNINGIENCGTHFQHNLNTYLSIHGFYDAEFLNGGDLYTKLDHLLVDGISLIISLE